MGEPAAVAEARARVMEAGFGRMVSRRGEASEVPAFMMLGSCTLLGEAGAYEPALPGGEADLEGVPMPSCSWIGDGIDVSMVGEWVPVEDPDETEVVLFRRLLPWLSWW